MEIYIKQHKGDEMIVRYQIRGLVPEQELLTFIIPASAVPHTMLCEIFRWGSSATKNQKHINQVFDYHYDQMKIAKINLESENAVRKGLDECRQGKIVKEAIDLEKYDG